MHDIKYIKDNPYLFDQSLKKRNLENMSETLIIKYIDYTSSLKIIEDLKMQRNVFSKKIGFFSQKKITVEADELKEKVSIIKEKIIELSEEVEKKIFDLNKDLSLIPNILDIKVPYGKSEEENVTVRINKIPKKFNFKAKDHTKIVEELGLLNYEQAVKICGARFSVLKSELALLHRALGNFMLDTHTLKNKYTEMKVPELVKSSSLYGTGQLPKFEDDLFKTSRNLFLIPTAEVPLTNLFRDSIIDDKNLPLRFTALTNCFRSEAGSAGMDTKGLIREHQFSKVELVSITKPEDSMNELERMVVCVEDILKELDLPYKLVELCSGDVGFSSSYTLDFEVWMPGQKKYREVSSCSNCKDFQSRRMMMRSKNFSEKKNYFPHTLNGSGLAIGRIIVAIIENYQNEDGSISIPTVLQDYMGGLKKIVGL